MRLLASIILSAAIWMILPLAFELDAVDTRTSRGWEIFLEELPIYLARWYGVFVLVAAVMHKAFAGITLRLSRWEFFAFPLLSLFCATVAFSVFWYSLIDRISPADFVYPLLGSLYLILWKMIWITYPLALANQWLIRCLLHPLRPCVPHPMVKSDGLIHRILLYLGKRV
ncbi:hypothetical protein [Luteolibacter sp. AS25]|uniref:hypothetical protein n=1 Tax=Luteolibacter sp. AS25 TaxID=3135776 RepID=UPI00398B532A